MNQNSHNLNIQNYSLEELLGLFELNYNITFEDMKRAKKRVLMLHPDKSKLSAEYFLFYKKAFEIVVRFYENQNKQNQSVTPENTVYQPMQNNDMNKSMTKTISQNIQKMSTDKFQDKFNQLFEENMSKKPNAQKNEWFTSDAPTFDIDKNVNASNMTQAIDTIKQKNQSMVRYQGVENMYSNAGANVYDDDDDNPSQSYISSDPFSKLKYDDLRKVHKDQTVFAVSESDFDKVQQYSSVDHYSRERNKQPLDPMEKQKAEKMLASHEQNLQQQMMQRQYNANLRTMDYAEKNKNVLSSFMLLEHK
jgi:hypothetical protein